LRPDELDDLVESVTVRTYLLLEHGPQSDIWERGRDGAWRSYCDASAFDAALERISA
jgi:hypothetical protein